MSCDLCPEVSVTCSEHSKKFEKDTPLSAELTATHYNEIPVSSCDEGSEILHEIDQISLHDSYESFYVRSGGLELSALFLLSDTEEENLSVESNIVHYSPSVTSTIGPVFLHSIIDSGSQCTLLSFEAWKRIVQAIPSAKLNPVPRISLVGFVEGAKPKIKGEQVLNLLIEGKILVLKS